MVVFDYICLTDMLRAKDGDFLITDWLRNRNTIEFIGICLNDLSFYCCFQYVSIILVRVKLDSKYLQAIK